MACLRHGAQEGIHLWIGGVGREAGGALGGQQVCQLSRALVRALAPRREVQRLALRRRVRRAASEKLE
jgi:hypothetical protein